MRNLYSNNPIIPHKSLSLEKDEMKENKLINSIAKQHIRKLEDKINVVCVHIFRTNVYVERFNKKRKKNK